MQSTTPWRNWTVSPLEWWPYENESFKLCADVNKQQNVHSKQYYVVCYYISIVGLVEHSLRCIHVLQSNASNASHCLQISSNLFKWFKSFSWYLSSCILHPKQRTILGKKIPFSFCPSVGYTYRHAFDVGLWPLWNNGFGSGAFAQRKRQQTERKTNSVYN